MMIRLDEWAAREGLSMAAAWKRVSRGSVASCKRGGVRYVLDQVPEEVWEMMSDMWAGLARDAQVDLKQAIAMTQAGCPLGGA